MTFTLLFYAVTIFWVGFSWSKWVDKNMTQAAKLVVSGIVFLLTLFKFLS